MLDVVTSLEARPWYADDTVVLGVDDPLGHADGHWRIAAGAGSAEVTRTDEAADVRLDIDTLGSLYLGGVDVPTLAAAGRISGPPDSLTRFAALADGGPAPYCTTAF